MQKTYVVVNDNRDKGKKHLSVEVMEIGNVLIKFLNFKEIGVQEEALKLVYVICGFDCFKSVLVGIGVVAPLVRVLESGSDLGKQLYARCLMKVTFFMLITSGRFRLMVECLLC